MSNKNSPILGTSTGTPAEVFAYMRDRGRPPTPDEIKAFERLHKLCTKHGLRFEVAVALSDLECFNVQTGKPWNSDWYVNRYNFGGIGVTGTESQNLASQRWERPADGAIGLFLHLYAYTHKLGRLPDDISSYLERGLDERWDNVEHAGYRGIARRLSDLDNRWAARDNYGADIAERLDRIFGGAIVAKLTPYPAMVDRPLPDKYGAGMSWLARWTPDGRATGSFGHSMVGWLWSTDGYFRRPGVHSATDYGIGGVGDGASDGVIFRWINYHERRFAAGWASGWDKAPDFDGRGREYLATFGNAGINGTARSVELSGLVATPVSAKQWASYIHLLAAIHHRELRQSYEEFEWHLLHRDVAEKDCAFPRVYKYSREYWAAIVLIMKHYEIGADIPDTAKIAGLNVPLAGGKDGGIVIPPPEKPIFIPFPKSIVFHTRTGALSRQWATREADVVRRYDKGTRLRMAGYYYGEEVNGEDRWLVIISSGPSNNARIHASGLVEEIPDAGLPTVKK